MWRDLWRSKQDTNTTELSRPKWRWSERTVAELAQLYARPQQVTDCTLDALRLEYFFAGSRMFKELLQRRGHCVGRRHIRTLMQRMRIQALYCKPCTSARHPSLGHGYHLCPHAQGVDVLVCVLDWHSRKVLAWRLSNTMDADFCVQAVQEAIARWGTPAIFNADQGSQFTSEVFTGELKRHGIRISMDGKGAWRDNVFVECLWRSIKYEKIYLKAYDSMRTARQGIGQYLQFYNSQQPHQAHGLITPDEAYFAALPFAQMQEA